MTEKEPALGPVFSAKMDVSSFKTGDRIIAMASARLDKSWKRRPPNPAPDIPPQSHIVNARTDPTWHHTSAGKLIQGRLDWFSRPIVIVVGDYKDNVGKQSGHEIKILERSNRLGHATGGGTQGGVSPTVTAKPSWNGLSWELLLIFLIGLIVICICCICCVRSRRYKYQQQVLSELYEENAFTTRPYTDDDDIDEDEGKGDVEMKPYRNGDAKDPLATESSDDLHFTID
jgi:hypothetical protein